MAADTAGLGRHVTGFLYLSSLSQIDTWRPGQASGTYPAAMAADAEP
jgi:hypothetical protein